jgi:hypothetical protein
MRAPSRSGSYSQHPNVLAKINRGQSEVQPLKWEWIINAGKYRVVALAAIYFD